MFIDPILEQQKAPRPRLLYCVAHRSSSHPATAADLLGRHGEERRPTSQNLIGAALLCCSRRGGNDHISEAVIRQAPPPL